MSAVFIAGGTGYIGRPLIDALLRKGHDVHALVRLPSTRETAERLGLVTRAQMIAALLEAIETPPPDGVRVVEVPEIRRAGH